MKWRFAFFYTAASVLFFALYTMMILASPQTPLPEAIRAGFFTVAPASILGLLVWRLCRVMPWSEQHRTRFVFVHMIAAVVFTATWAGFTVAEIAIFTPPSVLRVYLQRALGWQLIMGLMTYGVIAGIAYAVQMTNRLAEQRALAARAELQVLRAQLNPHFLFNTLHSVTALVRDDPVAVEDALLRFGALLRYVLDAGKRDEDATVEDEIGFVRAYIELERLRLGDRLRVVEEVDQDALDCLIPTLSLQPLVENAIRHGIAPRANGGELRIRAHLADDRLVIEVRDDGVGSTQHALLVADGIGLSLVKKRIAARFGEDGNVLVETSPATGFSVVIQVPAQSARQPRRSAGLSERFELGEKQPAAVS